MPKKIREKVIVCETVLHPLAVFWGDDEEETTKFAEKSGNKSVLIPTQLLQEYKDAENRYFEIQKQLRNYYGQ